MMVKLGCSSAMVVSMFFIYYFQITMSYLLLPSFGYIVSLMLMECGH